MTSGGNRNPANADRSPTGTAVRRLRICQPAPVRPRVGRCLRADATEPSSGSATTSRSDRRGSPPARPPPPPPPTPPAPLLAAGGHPQHNTTGRAGSRLGRASFRVAPLLPDTDDTTTHRVDTAVIERPTLPRTGRRGASAPGRGL